MRFVAPARPTETVFSSSAKESKPIAVARFAVAIPPTPNTLLSSAKARFPPQPKRSKKACRSVAFTAVPLTWVMVSIVVPVAVTAISLTEVNVPDDVSRDWDLSTMLRAPMATLD